MTWQRYKLNLRNSLFLEEYFRVMEQFDSTLSSVIDSISGLKLSYYIPIVQLLHCKSYDITDRLFSLSLGIGCWLLVVGCRLWVVQYNLTNNQQFIPHNPQPKTNNPQPTTLYYALFLTVVNTFSCIFSEKYFLLFVIPLFHLCMVIVLIIK